MIAALILAAGASSRFGSDKRALLLAAGQTVLERVLHTFAQAGCALYLVARPGDALVQRLTHGSAITVIEHAGADAGIGSSLAAGMAVLQANAQINAAIIGLADMPWVQAATVIEIRQQLERGSALVLPVCAGQPGHPRGIGRSYFERLGTVTGDQGGRNRLPWAQATQVNTQDSGTLADIDTPQDWARLAQLTSKGLCDQLEVGVFGKGPN